MYPLPILSNEWRYHRRQSKRRIPKLRPIGCAGRRQNQRAKLIPWITQPPCQRRFVDLVSARIFDFWTSGSSPDTKIRCTFTYMRGKNYVKTDKLWLQHSALTGDGLDQVCMERGTLQNLYDYAVENMARVKNKTGSSTLPVLRSGPSGGRSFQDHAR
jgi:hypothetical protein